jgi:site-specific DNA-methyltransferase (adenine-specific)
MEAMAQMPDKAFELAIVDPPYFKGVATEGFYGGAKWKQGTALARRYKTITQWDDNIPDESYFKELYRVSQNQIVWGVNYYSKFIHDVGRIIWDKKNDYSTFSKAEIASCSLFDSVQIFRYTWNGMIQENMLNKENKIHPTQKPVALYKWLLTNYAKPGDRILDTHLGSGSIAIACYDLGYDLEGYEIDLEYYNAATARFDAHTRQQKLFAPPQAKQIQEEFKYV